VVDPVITKEALMIEYGRENPNIYDGGNAIHDMACLLSQKEAAPSAGLVCSRLTTCPYQNLLKFSRSLEGSKSQMGT
jgi:hypothetical protein